MTDSSATKFGEWLQQQFADRGVPSVLAASRELGVAHTSARAWVKGFATPSLENQKRIAEVLEIPFTRVLVASGSLDPGELGGPHSLSDIPTVELLAELGRRIPD